MENASLISTEMCMLAAGQIHSSAMPWSENLKAPILTEITKEYESNPDDSEEDFNPDMISSPVGIEKAVSDAGEDPDLQEDRYSYW